MKLVVCAEFCLKAGFIDEERCPSTYSANMHPPFCGEEGGERGLERVAWACISIGLGHVALNLISFKQWPEHVLNSHVTKQGF